MHMRSGLSEHLLCRHKPGTLAFSSSSHNRRCDRNHCCYTPLEAIHRTRQVAYP